MMMYIWISLLWKCLKNTGLMPLILFMRWLLHMQNTRFGMPISLRAIIF